MKRILLTVLAITLCLTIFSGCNKDSVSDKSIILTIAETEPSCPAFESNCFYAYDAEGVIYRVLWTNFTDLNEKDTVVVEYNKKEKLNISADITGGFHAKFEITATGIYSVDEWNDIIGNSSPAEYFQLQKNDNGVIIFNVIAGFPQAKYTFKDTDAEEYVGIALDNENGEINSLLFDLLNGKSAITDDESDAFTDCVSMTYSYTSDDGHSEITVVYEFKWSSASNTMTIIKNNTLVGTVLLSDDEMSAFKDALANVSVYTDPDSNSGKRLPIVMTIAETLPSCVAFEYKDGNPYCFYAYDDDGKLYRVLWNNFDGLNEKDRIVVDHNDNIVALNYDEYPSGWTPQYEITAISIYSEEEWNAFEQNGANEN